MFFPYICSHRNRFTYDDISKTTQTGSIYKDPLYLNTGTRSYAELEIHNFLEETLYVTTTLRPSKISKSASIPPQQFITKAAYNFNFRDIIVEIYDQSRTKGCNFLLNIFEKLSITIVPSQDPNEGFVCLEERGTL